MASRKRPVSDTDSSSSSDSDSDSSSDSDSDFEKLISLPVTEKKKKLPGIEGNISTEVPLKIPEDKPKYRVRAHPFRYDRRGIRMRFRESYVSNSGTQYLHDPQYYKVSPPGEEVLPDPEKLMKRRSTRHTSPTILIPCFPMLLHCCVSLIPDDFVAFQLPPRILTDDGYVSEEF